MGKYSNEETEKFRKYWKTIPRGEKKNVRKQLVSACNVEYYTVSNWLDGSCRIPYLAKEKIEEVVGVEIFNKE